MLPSRNIGVMVVVGRCILLQAYFWTNEPPYYPTERIGQWLLEADRAVQTHKLKNSPTQKLKNSKTHQLKNSSTHQLKNSLTQKLTNPLTHQLKNLPTQKLINSKTHQLKNALTQQLTNSLTQQLTNSKTQIVVFILQNTSRSPTPSSENIG